MNLLGFICHYNEGTRFTCLHQTQKINDDDPSDDPTMRFKLQGNLKPHQPPLSSYTATCG